LGRFAIDGIVSLLGSLDLPGRAGDRAKLASAVDGRIFFAGEATSPNFFSTCHGALESGMRAAGEVIGNTKAL
jgi:monoamine oxidase